MIEKCTAKMPGRPVFNSLLTRIKNGEATGILAWHPDRLARNSVDGGEIVYLIDTGVIKSLVFPSFWFEPSPQGKFMLNMAFGQSKYYVDSLSEIIRKGPNDYFLFQTSSAHLIIYCCQKLLILL